MNTSLISILSSEHGRLRRDQRDIRKRDLQKAVKYGTKEKAKYMNRWKYVYDGIVFITDQSSSREVTCYPSPLSKAPVDDNEYTEHLKAKKIISRKPDLCTSHTVLVVDNSGSMMVHDIPLHRDRQTAAFSTMALEYIAEQLFNGTANNKDVVSLVEFSNEAKIVFEREPTSWVLYNKLLSRRDTSGYNSRQSALLRDIIHSDSNYLPALDEAEKLLGLDNHEDCALSMFFISDGQPTDALRPGLLPVAARRLINDKCAKIATRFDYQLNVSFVGFGGSSKDFSTLKSMADAANEAVGTKVAEFVYCNKIANAIGDAISSLAESTTLTRTCLLNGERRTKKNTRTDIKPEESNEWVRFRILEHYVYDPSKNQFVAFGGLPLGALRAENIEEAKLMHIQQRFPPYISINKGYLGTGAERVAYRCHLSDEEKRKKLAPMIAKETLRVDRIEEHIEFHKTFCETQSLAAHLAVEFNKRLQGLPNYSSENTPNVSFLKCSVLVLEDPEWQNGKRGVLVEKQLDTNKFEWRKWNNNVGAVDGKIFHRPMDVDRELAKLENPDTGKSLGDMMIIEEGSEEEDSDDDDDDYDEGCGYCAENNDTNAELKPSDYLQAFSHFTYLFTNRKVLVCDLQGVYNTEMKPPTFELSDPAIHYRSNKGRAIFGRTDKGQKGIQLFFNSHKCTGICKIMQLSQKNKSWKQHWRRDFQKDMENNFTFTD
ncbi:unnamed protein product [Pseudo-nitzschia multistriata]|uniref:Alpha-type protein kinase domain-containing protein n=1 Tax=Pseudo-nitzschia multistriata TaxID=183589 RepID=A0A448ZEJ8_9STRA|nr:unnamed protein product [Pseudo-nitzschia multistriata]